MKALFRLSGEGTEAHTTEVATRLGVTPGTVTAGVKRLADRSFVIHRPYRGIELTASGRLLALSVIRRHRIIERFLSDMLGYTWQDADRLAGTFEHQVPKEVEHRIFRALGEPATCPHGFPIPQESTDETPTALRLTELAPGEPAAVAIAGETEADVVEFLATLGVRPGVSVEVRERLPFSGPVVVTVDGQDRTVGEGLAQRIHVVPVAKKQRQSEPLVGDASV